MKSQSSAYSPITSNAALEGSSLSEEQVRTLLEQGICTGGKTLSELIMVASLKKAYDLSAKMIKDREHLSVFRVKQLAALALEGSGVDGNSVSNAEGLRKLCDAANEAKLRQRGKSREELYKSSFDFLYGVSLIKPWKDHNGLMARLLMHHQQLSLGLDLTLIGPSRASEYKRILDIALDEEISDLFSSYMLAHLDDLFEPYMSESKAVAPKAEATKAAVVSKPKNPEQYKPRIRGASREKILELLKLHPFMSAGDLASSMGISTKAVEKQIVILKAMGALQRVGPDKGGRWVVTNKARC